MSTRTALSKWRGVLLGLALAWMFAWEPVALAGTPRKTRSATPSARRSTPSRASSSSARRSSSLRAALKLTSAPVLGFAVVQFALQGAFGESTVYSHTEHGTPPAVGR